MIGKEREERDTEVSEAPQPKVNWEEEAARFKDHWMRALAEAENARKRASKDYDDALKYGVTKLAQDVLSIADNMKRALESCPESIPNDLEGLIGGIKLIEGEIKSIFDRHGIKELNPLGEAFDPHFHQAMFDVQASENLSPGTVGQVLQVGYVIHDRLLRPALVAVVRTEPKVNVHA